MKFTVYGRLESLNPYINSQRGNKYGGANLKKGQTKIVALSANGLEAIPDEAYPIKLSIVWYEKNKKRDPDNIVFAKKFILDGLQSVGVIRNDGWGEIASFSDVWRVDKLNPRVEIALSWSIQNEQNR